VAGRHALGGLRWAIKLRVREMLLEGEAAAGLPAPAKGVTDAQRLQRVVNSGVLSPDLYEALYEGKDGREH
jgi:hypothetical protein